jgi:DNA-binding CsgD family transcriptional regulator
VTRKNFRYVNFSIHPVGVLRLYCKQGRRATNLFKLIEQLRRNANKPARECALPREWSLSVEAVDAILTDYKLGRSTYQIAAKLNVRRNTVRDVLRRNGFQLGVGKEARLTPEQKEEIRLRRAAGEGPTALAKAFGVSVPTIKRALLNPLL